MTPEFSIALTVSLVVGIIGYLLNRSIGGIDKKLDATCNAVEAMKLEMRGYEELAKYLKADVEAVKAENTVLRRSFTEIDKLIYGLGLASGHPTPPPPHH